MQKNVALTQLAVFSKRKIARGKRDFVSILFLRPVGLRKCLIVLSFVRPVVGYFPGLGCLNKLEKAPILQLGDITGQYPIRRLICSETGYFQKLFHPSVY